MTGAPSPLLVLNPNRSTAMTARVRAQLQAQLPGVELIGATAIDGPAVIDNAATFEQGAASAQALLDTQLAQRPDIAGVLLACFGDPALEALRQRAGARPVWGLADAAWRWCAATHGPCAVITCGPAWVPLLQQRAAQLGHAQALVGVWALPVNGAQMAAEPARWQPELQRLANAAVAAGARALVLGGAAFAGLGLRIDAAVPVVDGIEAALALMHSDHTAR